MIDSQAPMGLIASFRMYDATPSVAAAWRAVLEPVFAASGADVRVVEHRYPAPIASLWSEPELCGAFMCGLPFVRSKRPMQAIAAPVPSPSRYAGIARYCSEFLVRADSAFRAIEETFRHRIGWMTENSQSGFNAPRAFLARYASDERCPAATGHELRPHGAQRSREAASAGESRQRRTLYAESRGPYVTPIRLLDALLRDEVDVVAVDGFFLDLLRHHEPARLAGIRTVAETPWTPIPLLVAAPGVDRALVDRLRRNLLALHGDPAQRPLLDQVLVARFVAPDVQAYEALNDMTRFAIEHGYETIR